MTITQARICSLLNKTDMFKFDQEQLQSEKMDDGMSIWAGMEPSQYFQYAAVITYITKTYPDRDVYEMFKELYDETQMNKIVDKPKPQFPINLVNIPCKSCGGGQVR